MPRKPHKMPNFKSEAEEAEWYATPAGRRQTRREYQRAVQAGTLIVNSKGLEIPRTDPKVLADLLRRAKEKPHEDLQLQSGD